MGRGPRSRGDNKILNKLVSDCITYRLHEKEALEYIEKEFGESISNRAYWRRRRDLTSDESNMVWINWFTRIGFLEMHKKQVEDVALLLEDSVQALHKLEHPNDALGKPVPRNDALILRYKQDIRETERLLAELGLGIPLIAAIKKRIDDAYSINHDPVNSHYYNHKRKPISDPVLKKYYDSFSFSNSDLE